MARETLFRARLALSSGVHDLFSIKTETDPEGGNAYSIIGTSQLLSVPYAFYAKTAGSSVSVDAEVARAKNAEELLQSNLDSLVNKQIALATKLQLFTIKIQDLTLERDSAISQRDEALKNIGQLQKDIADSIIVNSTRITELTNQISELKIQAEQLKTQLDAANATIESLTLQFNAFKQTNEAALNKVNADLETANSTISSLIPRRQMQLP